MKNNKSFLYKVSGGIGSMGKITGNSSYNNSAQILKSDNSEHLVSSSDNSKFLEEDIKIDATEKNKGEILNGLGIDMKRESLW